MLLALKFDGPSEIVSGVGMEPGGDGGIRDQSCQMKAAFRLSAEAFGVLHDASPGRSVWTSGANSCSTAPLTFLCEVIRVGVLCRLMPAP
jgi:hypothetical protein